MAEEVLKLVIKNLTFDKIQEEVTKDLETLLKEGFQAAKDDNFPAHNLFQEIYKEVLERNGLIDAWLLFICICSFAQGVSVGRGRKEIEEDDINITRNTICDDAWPGCPVMRLRAFSNELKNIIQWYDKP